MKLQTRISPPVERGNWKKGGSGKRNDLLELVAKVRQDPTRLHELALEHPAAYCRNRGGLKDIAFFALRQKASKGFRQVRTMVLHGEGGIGKTGWVYEKFPDCMRIVQPDTNLWFDEYSGEDVLLIDDFYGWIKWGQLLTLLDGYPLRIATKGGHTWANWTKIIITSNLPPNHWYQGKDLTMKEFDRRLHDIVHVTSSPDPAVPRLFVPTKGALWNVPSVTVEEDEYIQNAPTPRLYEPSSEEEVDSDASTVVLEDEFPLSDPLRHPWFSEVMRADSDDDDDVFEVIRPTTTCPRTLHRCPEDFAASSDTPFPKYDPYMARCAIERERTYDDDEEIFTWSQQEEIMAYMDAANDKRELRNTTRNFFIDADAIEDDDEEFHGQQNCIAGYDDIELSEDEDECNI